MCSDIYNNVTLKQKIQGKGSLCQQSRSRVQVELSGTHHVVAGSRDPIACDTIRAASLHVSSEL